MKDRSLDELGHPRGTLAVVGLFGLLFAFAWLFTYVLVFLERGAPRHEVNMEVDLYERIWLWAATALIAVFLGAIILTAGAQAIEPPSHVETIDPTTISTHPEFSKPTITRQPDGTIVVPVVTSMFAFNPDPIELPANVPITFRITSQDVIHGFEIAGTNANAMAIPGYVSQFTVTFPKSGQYAIVCNEFCGLVHHMMVGHLTVK